MVSVGELVSFKIITLMGIYNATLTWVFPTRPYSGSYDTMKKFNYKFTKKVWSNFYPPLPKRILKFLKLALELGMENFP